MPLGSVWSGGRTALRAKRDGAESRNDSCQTFILTLQPCLALSSCVLESDMLSANIEDESLLRRILVNLDSQAFLW